MKTLTDEALAVAIPIAFPTLFPDAMKHDVHPYGTLYKCKQCKKDFPWHGNSIPGLNDKPCTVPPPIDINDWNVVEQIVRHVDMDKFQACLEIAWQKQNTHNRTFESWLIIHASPADYLRAALEAKGAE